MVELSNLIQLRGKIEKLISNPPFGESSVLFESVNRFVTNNESVESSARSLVRLLV